MPELHRYAVPGRRLEQQRAPVCDITGAVVRDFASPAKAVMVHIVEPPEHNKAKGGFLFNER